LATIDVLITETSQAFISGYLFATGACSTIARNRDGFVWMNRSAVISLWRPGITLHTEHTFVEEATPIMPKAFKCASRTGIW